MKFITLTIDLNTSFRASSISSSWSLALRHLSFLRGEDFFINFELMVALRHLSFLRGEDFASRALGGFSIPGGLQEAVKVGVDEERRFRGFCQTGGGVGDECVPDLVKGFLWYAVFWSIHDGYVNSTRIEVHAFGLRRYTGFGGLSLLLPLRAGRLRSSVFLRGTFPCCLRRLAWLDVRRWHCSTLLARLPCGPSVVLFGSPPARFVRGPGRRAFVAFLLGSAGVSASAWLGRM